MAGPNFPIQNRGLGDKTFDLITGELRAAAALPTKMSKLAPSGTGDEAASPIEIALEPRPRDIGGFEVGRVLPAVARRSVGPFVFFDHMGPAELLPGRGIDVRPHPHINLATVTYLFEGELVHRDSLGSLQTIVPGEVNWMTAGRGIVHSERTGDDLRRRGSRLHGIQLWVALPLADEETEPSFSHHSGDALPQFERDGASWHLLVGSAHGHTSEVPTFSPMFYADVKASPGSLIRLPSEYAERAAYLVKGRVSLGNEPHHARRLLVFGPERPVVIRAEDDVRLVVFGGARLDGPRHIFWNFVSSSKERIERAKLDWKQGKFPKVAGDEKQFIPLPEG